MKKLCLVFILLGVALISGCSSIKSLSPNEKSSTKTIYIERDSAGLIWIIGFGAQKKPKPIYAKPFSDHLLVKIKTHLTEKGYRITENAELADARLVLRPNPVIFGKWQPKGFGFFVGNEGDAIAFASLSIDLIDSKTGQTKAYAKNLFFRSGTDLDYPPQWNQLSKTEIETLISNLTRAGFTAFYVAANRMNL